MRTVLVPVDGSALSESALPHALGLASRAEAQLELIFVRESPLEGVEWPSALEESLQALAARVKARLHMARGNPAEEILNRAESIQADLVVMGTHGRRGISRWLIGSVADKVMRHAVCPVLLVRPPSDLDPQALERALAGDYPRYPRLLVPLDGTPASEVGLGPACWLARHDQSELSLLRVLDFPTPIFTSSEIPSTWADMARERLDEDHKSYIEKQAERLRTLHYDVHSHYRHGAAADRILEQELDLTVMVSQSRGGFFGSVASRVAHRATGPVLVLRGGGALMRLEPEEVSASLQSP